MRFYKLKPALIVLFITMGPVALAAQTIEEKLKSAQAATELLTSATQSLTMAQTPSQENAGRAASALTRDSSALSPEKFKSRVFQIKYRDPENLREVLKLLGSGDGRAGISSDREFKTITVRDLPENIAVIEDAIKRLDVPEPTLPDMELRIHVLLASNEGSGSGDYPAELSDVIKQLKATLKYTNYSLVASSIHRAQAGNKGISNKGVADQQFFPGLPGADPKFTQPVQYNYELEPPLSIQQSDSGRPVLQIRNFSFHLGLTLTPAHYEYIGFETPLTVRDHERVVVGSTTLGNKAIVVVLLANVIKNE